jgi:hypothetical protein
MKTAIQLTSVMAAALLCLALPGKARAGQEEWVFSVVPTASTIRAWSKSYYGGGAGLALEYGMTDSWTARMNADYAGHVVTSPELGLLSVARLGGGVVYMLDVLRVIPYLHLGLDVAAIGGKGVDWDAYLGIQVGGGVDYLLSREWSIGLEVGYEVFVPESANLPAFVRLGFRLSRRWY